MSLRSVLRLALARRVTDAISRQCHQVQPLGSSRPIVPSIVSVSRRPNSTAASPDAPSPSFAASQYGSEVDLTVPLLHYSGRQVGSYTLPGDVFNTTVRRDILHRVVRWQLAARQQGTHKTKTRSEVSGGGRKPRPQKGSGRSRQGTIRAGQWRGGGVIHGPVPRSHAFKLLKSIRRLGLKSALSAKAREGRLLIVNTLRVSQPKTKALSEALDGLLADASRRSVLLSDLAKQGGDGGETLRRASSNLPWVDVVPSAGLNVYSILRRDYLVLTTESVKAVVDRLRQPIRPGARSA